MPICFDLDGTLGHFAGGYVLLREALGDIWGQPPTEEELRACAGSTDWEIVDELHRGRFGTPLAEAGYDAYDHACLHRFRATFHPGSRMPRIHDGLVAGLTRLLDGGHDVWLVSGNTPRILTFKARTLGVDPRVREIGSLPHHSRTQLIRRVTDHHPAPHLYVGDRPHDRDAARAAGIPFLAVGPDAPGEHPALPIDAPAEALVQLVGQMVGER